MQASGVGPKGLVCGSAVAKGTLLRLLAVNLGVIVPVMGRACEAQQQQ